MGHVTLTTPVRGYFVILRLILDIFYTEIWRLSLKLFRRYEVRQL